VKRIVICADGTWNQADQVDRTTGKRRPTNVTKTARAVVSRTPQGIDQVVFYHDGIGTSGGWLDRHTDGAFGHGMEDHIRDLYRFVVFNYVPGDEIFLFGFSRGAFTVRSFAGFLNYVGLLEKDDDYYAPELFELYTLHAAADSDPWRHAHRNIKRKHAPPLIKFIGVWDTVGALGAPGLMGQVLNRNKYRFHDTDLHGTIQNVAHALAIDERREAFTPTFFERPPNWHGSLQQAWFAGVHSNIGGGYDPDGLANEALHWVLGEASALGLELDPTYLEFFEPHYDSKLRDSMTLTYRVMGSTSRSIGLYKAHGECVHESARRRVDDVACNYAPRGLLDCLARGALGIVSTKPLLR
jgi:uncharacterized protein (DUF2235 family)